MKLGLKLMKLSSLELWIGLRINVISNKKQRKNVHFCITLQNISLRT